MKINHLFGLAVIAAMTASCSSNEDLGTAGPGTGSNETGVGYASFSINLPTTSGTRAAGDPTFEKGDANEYDVFNATLLVFKKGTATSEGDYTLAETVDLGSMEPWKKPNETGVTTQAKITAKLGNVDKNEAYFALVLLNNGSGTDEKVNLPAVNTKYSEWNIADNAKDKFANYDKGFYMANAPLHNNIDKSVTTLVAIDQDKIFPTEAQASSGEAAADIYVERGLAKVTLTAATKNEKIVGGSTYKGDKVTISNWALDVTNKKTFPIHNVDGLSTDYTDIWKNDPTKTAAPSTQRFVDNNSDTKVKRVYWGIDPNYKNNNLCSLDETGEKARATEFNYVKNNTDVKAKPTDPLYCLENTFNLENMKQGQTTRVIFKASYTPNDFTTADGKTFYKVGTSVALWSKTNLEDHIKAAVSKVIPVTTTDDITIKLDAEDNNITAAGNHEITKSNIVVRGHIVTEADVKAVNEKVGLTEKAGISTYANGESYYIARIKHFGDDLTPWKSGETYKDNLKYLGRYGMLRNNWYVLDVNSVSGPGYPDVPEVKPNTPDDEDDKYINVSVKILDWAKRSQTLDL